MFKRIFVCMLTLSVVAVGFAQDFKPLSDEKQSEANFESDVLGGDIIPKPFALSVGPKIGGLYTLASDPSISVGMSGGIGYSGGIAANLRFGRRSYTKYADTGRFGVQLEALYSQRTLSTDYEDIKMNGFEVPVLFQWWFAESICAEIGATFCGTFSSSPDIIEITNASLFIKDLKSKDAMFTVGAEYKHKKGFTASVRFNLGNSELAGNLDSKVSTVSLGIGWLFNIVK